MALMGHMKVSGLRHWTLLNGLKKRKNRCFVASPANVREVYVFFGGVNFQEALIMLIDE